MTGLRGLSLIPWNRYKVAWTWYISFNVWGIERVWWIWTRNIPTFKSGWRLLNTLLVRWRATVLRLIISMANSWLVHILEQWRVSCYCAIVAFGCDHTALLANNSQSCSPCFYGVIETLVKVWESSQKLGEHEPQASARVTLAFVVLPNFQSCLYLTNWWSVFFFTITRL